MGEFVWVARGGVEPPTSHFSGERSYQLSYLATTDLARDQPPRLKNPPRATGVSITRATPTGLEPAASAVTGRRSNQLSYGAKGAGAPGAVYPAAVTDGNCGRS